MTKITIRGRELWVGYHHSDDYGVWDPSRASDSQAFVPIYWLNEKTLLEAPRDAVKKGYIKFDDFLNMFGLDPAQGLSRFRAAAESYLNWEKEEETRKYLEVLDGIDKNYYREARCYSCKNEIDSHDYPKCLKCGWIICSCGACGCRYRHKN